MNSPPPLKAIPAGNADNLALVYDQETRASLSRKVEFLLPWPEAGEPKKEPVEWPEETEVLFGTWGMPSLTPEVLERLPNLKVLFYGAGSVKALLSDAFFRKGIRVFTGARANAVPVAEFALAQILLHLKGISRLRVRSLADWRHYHATNRQAYPGNYRSRVGLVSYGAIARILRDRLRAFDPEVFCLGSLPLPGGSGQGRDRAGQPRDPLPRLPRRLHPHPFAERNARHAGV